MSEEFVGCVWSVCVDTFLFRFLYGWYDNGVLLRAVGFWVECQYCYAWVGYAEVALHACVQCLDFCNKAFFGKVCRNVLDCESVGGECYAQRLIYHYLYAFRTVADACLRVFLQILVAVVVGRHVGVVDRTGYKHIVQLASEVGHGAVESLQCSFARLLSRCANLYLHLVVEASKQIDASVLSVFCAVDDAEVGLDVHRLTMIGGNLRRTVDDRSTKLQHLRLSKGFKDEFVSDTVGIAVRYGNAYFSIFHCILYIVYK